MRLHRAVFLLVCTTLAAPGVARAVTCTVTDMRVLVRSLDLEGLVPVNGMALPVTIDETSGSFAIDLTNFPPTGFNIIVDNTLTFSPRVYTGTIDSAGNILLPQVSLKFVTSFGGGAEVDAAPDLSTGLGTVTIAGRDSATEGERLDFSSGALVLEGQVALEGPPGSPGRLTTGLHLGCTLAPVPDATKLPKGIGLAAAAGQAKLAAGGGTGVEGDALKKLAARLTLGAAPLDFSRGLFVRLRDAAGADVLLVRASVQLTGKKAKVVDADKDGTTIRVVTGRRTTGAESAPLNGKVVVKQKKKALLVTLSEGGLDLSGLAAGPATVTIGVGDLSASRAVTVTRTATKVRFK